MGCEKSFITMKPIRHSYLVSSLGNCAMKLCTETGLRMEMCSVHSSDSRSEMTKGAGNFWTHFLYHLYSYRWIIVSKTTSVSRLLWVPKLHNWRECEIDRRWEPSTTASVVPCVSPLKFGIHIWSGSVSSFFFSVSERGFGLKSWATEQVGLWLHFQVSS